MTDKEVMQQALFAMLSCETGHPSDGSRQLYDENLIDPAIEALRATLAQPEPEPVAWMVRENFADLGLWEERIIFTIVDEGRGIPLYTAPPQPKKEWVGLTENELLQIHNFANWNHNDWNYECAIEAKLKEKNT